MIEKMSKLTIAVASGDVARLMRRLGALGLMHIIPADPAISHPSEELIERIKEAESAITKLREIRPQGSKLALDARTLVRRVLRCSKESKRLNNVINKLKLRLRSQVFWGDLDKSTLAIVSRDVKLKFCVLPWEQIANIQADLVKPLRRLKRTRWLVAAASIGREIVLPAGSEELSMPLKDNRKIRLELAALQIRRQKLELELAGAAGALPTLERYVRNLRRKADFVTAVRSAFVSRDVVAIQGWIPHDRLDSVVEKLKEDLVIAVMAEEPGADEEPPTLIRYGRITQALEGLFKLLGAYPGYRESDLSAFYIVALPVFAAIIIADAGYALVVLLTVSMFGRMFVNRIGAANTRLVLMTASLSLVYGLLVGSYFGFTPEDLVRMRAQLSPHLAGGLPQLVSWPIAVAAQALISSALFWQPEGEAVRLFLTKFSLLLGVMHLVGARLAKAFHEFPDQRSFAEIGWGIFLSGIFGLVWLLLLGKDQLLMSAKTITLLLGAGISVVIIFSRPHANPIVRVFGGVGASLFSCISAFSDILSYIRLMAIGLASYYIASVTNQLAIDAAAHLGLVAGVTIGILGHAINMALALIAIFAHAVRLNMLEFSMNAGVQWMGYPFRPYTLLSNGRA
jgi:V/A-type H+-transporting ATPase subunit I